MSLSNDTERQGHFLLFRRVAKDTSFSLRRRIPGGTGLLSFPACVYCRVNRVYLLSKIEKKANQSKARNGARGHEPMGLQPSSHK